MTAQEQEPEVAGIYLDRLPMERPARRRPARRDPLIRAGIAAGLEKAITQRVLIVGMVCLTLLLLTIASLIAGGGQP